MAAPLAPRYLLIDNYDSFTYNLWHYLGELGADVAVHRNDKIAVDEVLAMAPAGIILSPGPCDPDRAGICLPLIAAITEKAGRKIPMFGVCLGLQSIGQAFGGKVVRAPQPMHGKVSVITHTGHAMFAGVPQRFHATRYHSLVVDKATLPTDLVITAESGDGQIMGLAHKTHPITSVQFHPESIASDFGHRILGNFLRATGLATNPEPVLHRPATAIGRPQTATAGQ
ncbi:MAG: aminodeoxychorismate/anthranilate synthase component II [Rhodospirillaceae bacterium]|nr:aminodeoxychorismate/anthranilate synthase component II [Rhodospirillaceae bacterium]